MTGPGGNEVSVKGVEPGVFEVEIQQGSLSTSHRVRVPKGMADDIGLPGLADEALVRESMDFLLEREPASSILPEFGLDIIGRYFPEYRSELPRRFRDA